LRQNREPKNIYGRFYFFAPLAQKNRNVRKIFSGYDFDAKRQRVSKYLVLNNNIYLFHFR
jgi:CMP-N-acetylneuraminic acid synthetase